MDPDTGIFTCPLGGVYMFVFHVATHDNKKALLSIRLNGEEVASVFDQNHKVSNYILLQAILNRVQMFVQNVSLIKLLDIFIRITIKTRWPEQTFSSP